jgi:flagella synthesis protein FlgN
MIVPLDASNFASVLETEKNTLKKFIEILKKEEDALVQGKIEEIDYLAADKSHLIEELVQINDRRNEYIKNQGLISERNTVSSWLKEHYSDQSEVQISWNELLVLAQIAQKISHSNGLIISTRLQHNQRAFAALHCAAGNISLYGPKGQAYI